MQLVNSRSLYTAWSKVLVNGLQSLLVYKDRVLFHLKSTTFLRVVQTFICYLFMSSLEFISYHIPQDGGSFENTIFEIHVLVWVFNTSIAHLNSMRTYSILKFILKSERW